MSNKKVVKLAVIRTDDEEKCPFGLPIPEACHMAGNAVDRMAPVDALGGNPSAEEKAKIAQANIRVWAWGIVDSAEEPAPCKYADKLFDGKKAVECSYGDTAAGEHSTSTLIASPFYSQIFSAIGMEGLYSYPLGYYADYNTSRNAYYGIYSLQGAKEVKDIVKLAYEYIQSKPSAGHKIG